MTSPHGIADLTRDSSVSQVESSQPAAPRLLFGADGASLMNRFPKVYLQNLIFKSSSSNIKINLAELSRVATAFYSRGVIHRRQEAVP